MKNNVYYKKKLNITFFFTNKQVKSNNNNKLILRFLIINYPASKLNILWRLCLTLFICDDVTSVSKMVGKIPWIFSKFMEFFPPFLSHWWHHQDGRHDRKNNFFMENPQISLMASFLKITIWFTLCSSWLPVLQQHF